jgi:hypothetical protein
MENSKILDFKDNNPASDKPACQTKFVLPQKAFFTLREACYYKNLNYKTACNQKAVLQPNGGKEDGKVGGRKVWRYATIANWISLTDDELVA